MPLKAGEKTPLLKQWHLLATTGEEQIRLWWKRFPNANIGVVTGKLSNLLVLDVDTDKFGPWSLMALEQKYGSLPETIINLTGNGGKHLLFHHPQVDVGNSAGLLGMGLDIRSDNGYIVVPPSLHPNGNHYQWSVCPWTHAHLLADFPTAWLPLITKKNKKVPQHAELRGKLDYGNGIHFVELAMQKVRRGQGRNYAGFGLACQLRDWGYTIDQAAYFMKIYVESVPPKSHPYDMDEALNSLESAYNGSKRSPARNPDEPRRT